MRTERNRRAEYRRGLLDNLRTINKTVRDAGIQVVSCVRCWKGRSRIARVGCNEPGPFPEVIWTEEHLVRC